MTIRFDENGNPYDDGEYDYSQDSFQEDAPQQEFAYEGGGGGSGGDYLYEEEPIQEDPVFVIEEPVVDPIVQEDPVFVAGELSVDPVAQEKLFYPANTTDPGFDSFNYLDDEPKEGLNDFYREEIIPEDPITKPIVAKPVTSEPVYADIRMGATSPASGTTRVVTSQFENARATPLRGGQDGSRGTPIRDRLFGRKGRYTQVEQPIEQTMEPFVDPEALVLRTSSPAVSVVEEQASMQVPMQVPMQKIDPLAPTSVGEYDYRPATIQGPPSELMRDPEFQPFDAAAVPASDRNGRFLGRVRFTDENNKAVRGFPFGDNAGQPAGQPLPKDDMRPLIRPPVGGIGADVGNPNPFADVDEEELDRQEKLRLERAKEAMRPVDPALRAMQDEEAKRNQAAEKLGRDRAKLIASVEDEENQKRALAIFQDPNSSKFAKEQAQWTYNEIQGRINDRKKEEEDLAHEKFVQEKVRRALNRFEKGATLEEAKTVPDLPNEPALRNLQPLGLGKGSSIYDTFKGFDDKEGEHAFKPNVNPNATLKNRDVEVVNRNESKAEELDSYKFISSGPNGLTPKMFPLASQVFDATVAEKNLNELKDMRYKELMDVSPTGALLKSQVKQQAIAKLLDDKSLNRVLDFVTEVHTGVAIGNTTENSTGTSNEISAKVSRSIPGSSMSTGGGTGNTFRSKNGSTNIENNWRGQSTNPTIEGSVGASLGETSRSSVGTSLSQTGGNSSKTSNSDNRLANYNSMSKQEQEVVDSILKTSSSARADIEGKYNPAIEKYEEKYKQLKSETSEVGGRLLYLGDVTGAGAAYPKQALDSTSKTAKMNIQQFLDRFNTTNPELQGGLKDISVKHGLFNQGPVDSNMKKRVDQLSNPAIADILDGKTYLPSISNMIRGKLPDVQYEAEKSMYDAEAPLRMEQTKSLDTTDPNFWAKYEGAIKSAATNSSFGKAVMAAKVLKAHDDLTQFFTNPSANPAENMMGDKRTLAPFNQYLDRLFNAAVMDPKANTVLGATGMEMALRISPYRQELTRIQNLNPVFTDSKNEATKYMIRALADPTNRDVYLQKVKELDPERYRGIGRPYAPVGNAPVRNAPANPVVPAGKGIMFKDSKPLLFK